MFNLKKSLIAIIAVLTLYGVEARGESFVITDVKGTVWALTSLDGGPSTLRCAPWFTLSGPGLSIWTIDKPSGDPGSVEVRDTCMESPCFPGRVLGTNSSFSGLISSWAGARVNGVYYWFVRVTGWLDFVSSPIVVPDVGTFTLAVTIPFTFSGELRGDAYHAEGVVNPVFTAKLSGQGLATFRFEKIRGPDFLSPRYKLDFIEYQFQPVPISIDVKPATFPNTINPNSKGKIPVAILTTPTFDATAVDPATILFGATGLEVAPVHSAMEDVDGDGDIDMVLHFVTQDTGITCGHTSASLTGALFSEVTFKGSDSIETVACN